jgi:CBS domain-containing protein
LNLEMKIKDLMEKDPLVVKPSESLAAVSKKMADEDKDVVVVMEGDTVRGLVTAKDIFFAMKSYVLGKNMFEEMPMEVRDMKIAELMRAPSAMEFMEACGLTGHHMCIVLGEDDKAADAIRVMAIGGVDNILIVGDEGVVGTLGEADLIKALE